MERSDPLVALKTDIETTVSPIPEAEWDRFAEQATELSAKKKAVILRQTEICQEILYITDGIAASEYVLKGKKIISRFFQKGNFCTNLISATTGKLDCDNLISITPLQALSEQGNYFPVLGRLMCGSRKPDLGMVGSETQRRSARAIPEIDRPCASQKPCQPQSE